MRVKAQVAKSTEFEDSVANATPLTSLRRDNMDKLRKACSDMIHVLRCDVPDQNATV